VRFIRHSGPIRIDDPQVSIDLVRLTGQKFFVLGEVERPGLYYLDGDTTLIDAVSMAGGFTYDAKPASVMLVRSGALEDAERSRVIDVNAFLREGERAGNPRLSRGDVVYVPRTFISKVDQAFRHIRAIVRPIVDIESGIWLGQNIDEGPPDRDGTSTRTTVINISD